MSSEASLIATMLGAVQGSVSVLLTISAGFFACRLGLLDRPAVKKMSNVASLIFLPCLIIVDMGPELTISTLKKVWILPVWGLFTTLLAHGIGWAGMKALKLPNWTIVASGRPNSSALPLLLLDSLSSTGVLDSLKRPGESTSAVLSRAQSLILLNVVVQQTFTFASGPSILAGDKDDDSNKPDRLLPGPAPGALPSAQDVEHVGLLHDHDGEDEDDAYRFQRPIRELQDTPDLRWPEKLRFMEKPAKKVAGFLNPPVIGAIIAVILGMTPALNKLFLQEDSPLYNSVTKAVDNLGQLFVALQMFTVGAQLQTVPSATPHARPTAFVLGVRYLIMPAVAVGFVWATAGRGWYSDDPLVWFLMVLIPSGPSAMILANLSELVDVDQGPIAAYLTIAYVFSPLIAIACTAGLAVVQSKTA